MSYILAKTIGKKGAIRKLISENNVYELPQNLSSSEEYNPSYILNEDQWYKLSDFSQKNYCIDFLKKDFISTEYIQIQYGEYSNIEYICSYQSNIYYFQKVSPSLLLKKNKINLSRVPTLARDESTIIINHLPDAVYKKDEDTLYFRSLSSVASIFKGIDILYREATLQETKDFLNNSFIKLIDEFSEEKVKNANRKRIAIAIDTLNKISNEQRDGIYSYIQQYCPKLPFDNVNKHFSIASEEDLKLLIYGIEQRYYTTIHGEEKRLANSIKKL